jgi:hypothetical protein
MEHISRRIRIGAAALALMMTLGLHGMLASALAVPVEPSSHSGERVAQLAGITCRRQLPNGNIMQRVRLADGQCRDEEVNPRTGKVVNSQPVPCNNSC